MCVWRGGGLQSMSCVSLSPAASIASEEGANSSTSFACSSSKSSSSASGSMPNCMALFTSEMRCFSCNTQATQQHSKGTCHDGLCCCHTNARGGWGGSAATTHIQKQRSQALHVQPQCWWLTWLWGAAIQGCKGHRDGVQVRYACSGEGDDVVA